MLTDVYSVTNITEQNKKPIHGYKYWGKYFMQIHIFRYMPATKKNMWEKKVRLFPEYIHANIFLLETKISPTEVHFTRGQTRNRAFI